MSDLVRKAAELLEGNRVNSESARYTRPAHGTYPHQWLWDSCFHALIYHRLDDTAFAKDELRALFRAQERGGRDDGRLPHMTFDRSGSEAYARDVALWANPHASTITQPPIVAEMVLAIGDRDFWRELWEPMRRFYDFWLRRRDPDGDDLYATWHVWEAGADATPRADEACHALTRTGRVPKAIDKQTVNPTAKKRQDLLYARFLMLEDLQAIDADETAGTLAEAEAQRRRERLFGHEAVDMQAYLVRNLLDLATIGESLGEDVGRYRERAARIIAAVNGKMWDEAAGFYFDFWGEPEKVVRIYTPAPFVALYAGEMVPRDRAERLLGHLLDPKKFWTRWPVPTVARDSEFFDADEYWRGSMWINVNWFIVRGLIDCSRRFDDKRYLPPARMLVERTLEAVERTGFREYYRADGDELAAFGPERFSWSALALDLERILKSDLR